jgi:hypothetical protein
MPAVHLTAPELRLVLQALATRTSPCPLVDGVARRVQLELSRIAPARSRSVA